MPLTRSFVKRIYWLRVPVRRRGLIYLLGLCVVGISCFIVAATSASFVLGEILGVHAGWGVALFVIPLSIVASLAPIWWIDRYVHARRLKPTALRTQRLSCILSHPAGFRRLPHRWVEYQLRKRIVSPSLLRRLVRQLPAGKIIVAMDRVTLQPFAATFWGSGGSWPVWRCVRRAAGMVFVGSRLRSLSVR